MSEINIETLKEIRYHLYNIIPDLPECHPSVMENSSAITHIQNLIFSLTNDTDGLIGGKKERTLESALKLQELVKERFEKRRKEWHEYDKIPDTMMSEFDIKSKSYYELQSLIEESEKT